MALYGVISSGRVGTDDGARAFKSGALVDFNDEQALFFLTRTPENFVKLSDALSTIWSEALALRFQPGQDCFHLLREENKLDLQNWLEDFACGNAPDSKSSKKAKRKKG